MSPIPGYDLVTWTLLYGVKIFLSISLAVMVLYSSYGILHV